MGRGESRRIIRLASDDLDVASRLRRGGPGQCVVKLAERGNLGREPSLATQRGGHSVIVPGSEVVVDPVRIRLERPLDHVPVVIEDKNDRC